MKSKNTAAVALGRKGGLKGGPARAAKLTPAQRSQSARKAVTARWARVKIKSGRPSAISVTRKGGTSANVIRIDRKRAKKTTSVSMNVSDSVNVSDSTLVDLLRRLKATVDPTEIRELSEQIERVVFHKQFMNA